MFALMSKITCRGFPKTESAHRFRLKLTEAYNRLQIRGLDVIMAPFRYKKTCVPCNFMADYRKRHGGYGGTLEITCGQRKMPKKRVPPMWVRGCIHELCHAKAMDLFGPMALYKSYESYAKRNNISLSGGAPPFHRLDFAPML
jgi:hypothetical protein